MGCKSTLRRWRATGRAPRVNVSAVSSSSESKPFAWEREFRSMSAFEERYQQESDKKGTVAPGRSLRYSSRQIVVSPDAWICAAFL